MPINAGKHNLEFVLEEYGSISRDEVVIAAAAAALPPGTVLGRITASGKYVAYSAGASDGSQVAAAINLYAVPDSTSDQKAVVIRRMAQVKADELTGLDAAARVALEARMIVAR